MTTQKLVVQQANELIAAVERIDTELKALLAELRATNDRMRQENEAMRKRLGLAPRQEAQP